jgi:hypothetical protein
MKLFAGISRPAFVNSGVSVHHAPNASLVDCVLLAEFCKIYTEKNGSIGVNDFKRLDKFFMPSSLFARTILHIVGLCSKKKMIRANTERSVAPMTNKKSWIKFSVMKFIRKAVCRKSLASILSAFMNNSIFVFNTFAFCCTNPEPTTISFGDLLPKSMLDWLILHARKLTYNMPTLNLIMVQ